jgi:peptide/nickel transport system ATP-binding protein
MPEPLLDVRGVSVSFGGRGRSRTTVVDEVDLAVEAGQSLGIVGESGCGKSTLARAIAGLHPLDRGEIRFAGAPLTKRGWGPRLAGADSIQRRRRAIQVVFQDPYASLNRRMTVGTAIKEVLTAHRLGDKAGRPDRVAELLDMVGLPRRVADVYPRQLSGGQRQRVSIALALAAEPELLIADEAVSALDVSVQATVLNLFADLRERLGLTLLFISHNMAVIRHVSDHVAVMSDGRIVETGPIGDVIDTPAHDYTKRLLAAVPVL